jgi:hypothetical protein
MALALAAPCAGAFAAQVSFAHFAPGAGPVTLSISGGNSVALEYRDFVGVREVADGARQIEVRNAAGAVLVQGQVTLGPNDREVIMLAGNGSESTPFQLRRSADHNRPFTADGSQASLQTASLAIVDLGFASLAGANSGVSFARRCGGEASSSSKLAFGYGTSALGEAEGASNLTLGKNFNACTVMLSVPGYSEIMPQAALSGRPGERKRIFVIGDGRREPYELFTVLQGLEPIFTPIAPTPGFEGLWSISGEANMGLQVAVNPKADGSYAATAIFFGYDDNGDSQWNVLTQVADTSDGLTVLEYSGGNPQGTQAAIALNRGTATLLFFSCSEAVLVPDSNVAAFRSALAIGEMPRDSIWLRKLFPVGGCSVPGVG